MSRHLDRHGIITTLGFTPERRSFGDVNPMVGGPADFDPGRCQLSIVHAKAV